MFNYSVKSKSVLLVSVLLLGVSFTANANNDVNTVVQQQTKPSHWSGLPLLSDKAIERGYELPIPVGVSLFYNNIDADYIAVNDFEVQVDGGLLGFRGPNDYVVPAEDVSISGSDRSVQLKIDAWILPFWNVYGLLGYTEGNKDILAKLDNVEGLPCDEACNGVVLPIPINYTAKNYGIGTVLAGQIDPIIGDTPVIVMAVGAIVKANTNTTDSVIKTKIASVRVGQRFDVGTDKLAWFLAFSHQSVDQNVTGDYSFVGTELEPLMEEVKFDIDLAKEETKNMSLSMNYDFGPKNEWNLYAEYGFLNWQHLIIGFGRRF
ncbi:hypothetical protein J8L86_15320 [Shewanella sp. MMG014]|uniref:hypothetical protein n=1 Tax=Shewanella sp. MMG014 TaxID=2822691 RepID=UPI001B377A2C|nr:hypothetical protein [Shewanella sp. MMG014]MBQ4891226.1 hypothetical protein [Shewanella sp. MMG014]